MHLQYASILYIYTCKMQVKLQNIAKINKHTLKH
jgi:hypothetical protein